MIKTIELRKVLVWLPFYGLLMLACSTSAPNINHLLIHDGNSGVSVSYQRLNYISDNTEKHLANDFNIATSFNIFKKRSLAFDSYMSLLPLGGGYGISWYRPKQYVLNTYLMAFMCPTEDTLHLWDFFYPGMQLKVILFNQLIPGLSLEKTTMNSLIPSDFFIPTMSTKTVYAAYFSLDWVIPLYTRSTYISAKCGLPLSEIQKGFNKKPNDFMVRISVGFTPPIQLITESKN
jgi:hypothetical protein